MPDEVFLKDAPFDDRFPAKIKSGLIADRPTNPEGTGDLYYSSDEGILYYGKVTSPGPVYEWIGINNYVTAAIIRSALGDIGWGKGFILTDDGSNLGGLAPGSNGDVLTLDSGEDLGVKWDTPGGGGGVATLDDVGDVNAPSPSKGALLSRNGSSEWQSFGNSATDEGMVPVWDNTIATGFTVLPFMLNSLYDVDPTDLAVGRVPTWTGAQYELQDPPGGGGGTFSGAYVRLNSGTTRTNTGSGSAIVVGFDEEVFDTDTFHDNSTNNSRLTIPSTDYYEITAQIDLNSPSVDVEFAIILNGSTYLGAAAYASGFSNWLQIVTGPVSLTAGDYIELQFFNNGFAVSKSITGVDNWLKIKACH